MNGTSYDEPEENVEQKIERRNNRWFIKYVPKRLRRIIKFFDKNSANNGNKIILILLRYGFSSSIYIYRIII
jgi:hypothetical protein